MFDLTWLSSSLEWRETSTCVCDWDMHKFPRSGLFFKKSDAAYFQWHVPANWQCLHWWLFWFTVYLSIFRDRLFTGHANLYHSMNGLSSLRGKTEESLRLSKVPLWVFPVRFLHLLSTSFVSPLPQSGNSLPTFYSLFFFPPARRLPAGLCFYCWWVFSAGVVTASSNWLQRLERAFAWSDIFHFSFIVIFPRLFPWHH